MPAHNESKRPTGSFQELRHLINERLVQKGLPAHNGTSGAEPSALEGSGVTQEDIDQLRADIAYLIKLEGRRGFWSGLIVNALFFGLGLGAPALIEIARAYSSLWGG